MHFLKHMRLPPLVEIVGEVSLGQLIGLIVQLPAQILVYSTAVAQHFAGKILAENNGK
jgi:hypothetical protein